MTWTIAKRSLSFRLVPGMGVGEGGATSFRHLQCTGAPARGTAITSTEDDDYDDVIVYPALMTSAVM